MFDFLPEHLRKHAFVAGGWAACPALATDRDVWVVIPKEGIDVPALRRHLESRALFYSVTFGANQRDYPHGTMKLADLTYPWEKVQLLLTHQSPEEVLSRFDITSHQIAIMADGRIVRGEQWTPVTVEPRVIRQNATATTRARMEKITCRYGFSGLAGEKIMDKIRSWVR